MLKSKSIPICLKQEAGVFLGCPGGSVVKNPSAKSGDAGSICGSEKSPGEGNSNPLQHSCLGNPMKRSLEGYNPWCGKELDMTWQLNNNCMLAYVNLGFQ